MYVCVPLVNCTVSVLRWPLKFCINLIHVPNMDDSLFMRRSPLTFCWPLRWSSHKTMLPRKVPLALTPSSFHVLTMDSLLCYERTPFLNRLTNWLILYAIHTIPSFYLPISYLSSNLRHIYIYILTHLKSIFIIKNIYLNGALIWLVYFCLAWIIIWTPWKLLQLLVSFCHHFVRESLFLE